STALWDDQGDQGSAGMSEMVATMRARRPDAPLSNAYVGAWMAGYATRAVLDEAAERGDLTRAGVVDAFDEVEVDFRGLASDQRWLGEPNEFIARESYVYDVVVDRFTAGATVSDEGAGTGLVLAAGP